MNRSDDYNEGTLWDCKNITSNRYPYYTTRKERANVNLHESVTAIYVWDKLIEVDGTDLYYDGVLIDTVEAGEKQFAVVNTKLVIFPDKKYLDFPTKTLVDMVNEIDITGTITVTAAPSSSLTQTVTVAGGYSTYADDFAPYRVFENDSKWEKVELVLTKIVNDQPVSKSYDLSYVGIANSSGNLVITFRNDNPMTSDTYSSAVLKRKIPNFDYICSSDNRLWGCVSKDQTIYASELGDVLSFYYLTSKESDASWVGSVDTPNNFTGCTNLGSSLVFFKEHYIHKVLGTEASDYTLYSYEMDGVKEGCYKSIQVINDNAFYLSERGVMVFSGSAPHKISDGLGYEPLSNGVAGTDGVKYYLSCKLNNEYRMFVYDPKYSVWLAEDHDPVIDFARYGSSFLAVIQTNGKSQIYSNTDEPISKEWFIQFNDMYESNYNNYGRKTGSVLNKKNYSKLILRVEMKKDSFCTVFIRCDGGRWTHVSDIVGKDGVFVVAVPINRCDKFGIRLEGKGEFSLLAMERQCMAGSVRNE